MLLSIMMGGNLVEKPTIDKTRYAQSGYLLQVPHKKESAGFELMTTQDHLYNNYIVVISLIITMVNCGVVSQIDQGTFKRVFACNF